ncbi:alpha-ketoglutarate-dependent dioxygenase alkB homolog 6-like isoform X2 [Scylla paramamosain]|uniref:alpha-ketoglutarate-dependent dioxygenase alkB homolog 6-like isoform X2 n=1 Tax=Scylla paramamosain TaxID=85552 RepID=UPI0030834654
MLRVFTLPANHNFNILRLHPLPSTSRISSRWRRSSTSYTRFMPPPSPSGRNSLIDASRTGVDSLTHAAWWQNTSLRCWLQQHMDSIAELGAFGDKRPNHVLVNEYLAGQGIMPHVDGPMFYPTITTISLSGHTLLDLYTPRPPDNMQEEMTSKEQDNSEDSHTSAPSAFENRYVGSLFLAPRSLLILQDDIYTTYLHGIAEVAEDVVSRDVLNLPNIPHTPGDTVQRDTRISLTIRHVPKINKQWHLYRSSL